MSVTVHHGDCREVLATLAEAGRKPHASVHAKRALEVGKAAEHLVCADLILGGYRAYLSDQGLPYDIVADLAGRLIRIQVKSTLGMKTVAGRPVVKYQWGIRRAGKGAKRRIGNDEFDILALVALDIRQIAYMPIDDRVRQTIHLRAPGVANAIRRTKAKINRCIDEYPFAAAVAELRP